MNPETDIVIVGHTHAEIPRHRDQRRAFVQPKNWSERRVIHVSLARDSTRRYRVTGSTAT